MQKQPQLDTQRGAVALITAMLISILLMITTVGMVSVTARSLRQSTDGAQSTKAFYAAEGGLEHAILQLKRDPKVSETCTKDAPSTSNSDGGAVTCVKVTNNDNELSGSVDVDEVKQLDLSSVAGVGWVKIEWDNQAPSNPDAIPNYKAKGFPEYPAPAGSTHVWFTAAPAVMEMGIVGFLKGVDIGVNDVKYDQVVLAPASASGGPTASYTASNGSNWLDYNNFGGVARPFVAKCKYAGYKCAASVYNMNAGGSAGQRYILRLRARYHPSNYRVTVYDKNLKQLSIPSNVYTIDVTARAGNTFRRAQTTVPIDNIPKAASGLDYVLYSDTDICKSFEIKSGVAQRIGCNVPL